jgi:hypothetical protein
VTVILLTASVDPMGRPGLTRVNPEARLADYEQALAAWIEAARDVAADVVFCENSGWPLDSLERLAAARAAPGAVTFLQFRGNDYAPELGKGFGEALIVDHFVDTSFRDDHRHDLVVKCTGRLFVSNIRAIVSGIAPDTDLACALDGALTWADSRLVIGRQAPFARYLSGLRSEIDESRGAYLEHALMRRVARAIGDGCRWRPFPELPRYVGRSATTGRRLDSPRERARWIVHGALRTLRYRPRSPL